MKYLKMISVIIPVYNSEKFLCRCLDSVLKQSWHNLQIICIDDGSTDNSNSILQNYAVKDNRVLVYRQNNQGAGGARNLGIKKANGKYIVFLDPDDFYPDNKVLEDLYNAIENNNVNIAGGGLIEYLPDYRYRILYADNDPKIFKYNGIINYHDYQYDYFFQRFIYSREFLLRNNIKFSLHKRQQDIVFFVKAMIAAKRFYSLKRRTYCYRVEYKCNKSNLLRCNEMLDATKILLNMAKEKDLEVLHKRIYKRFIFQQFEKILVGLGLIRLQSILKKYIFKYRFKIFLNEYFKGDIRNLH